MHGSASDFAVYVFHHRRKHTGGKWIFLFPGKVQSGSISVYHAECQYRVPGIRDYDTGNGNRDSSRVMPVFHDSVSVVLKRFAGTEGDKFLRFFHHAFFGWAGALIHYVDNHVPYKKYLVAYILPNFLLGAFNIILMRTFFTTGIPADLYEAAKIDGASYLTIYKKIVLPLGKPILVTVGLFTGLSYWNDWTNGLYYISKSEMLSIQALLNRMIQDIQALAAQSTADSGSLMQIPQVSIRMAIAFVAILPILIVYPFLQKYFASGIMLGAVKG